MHFAHEKCDIAIPSPPEVGKLSDQEGRSRCCRLYDMDEKQEGAAVTKEKSHDKSNT